MRQLPLCVSVVIPVYQNQDTLNALFKRLENIERILNQSDKGMEVIFVNDGSTDESSNLLNDYCSKSRFASVIELSRNFGATHAVKEGFRNISGPCAIVLPADLQDPPELVIKALESWESGSMVTICYRRTRKDPLMSRLTSRIFYAFIRRFVIPGYPPKGGDVFLIDSKLLPYLTNSSKHAYLQLLVHWLGYEPSYIPYDREERPHGRSQWTLVKRVTSATDVIINYSSLPLRLTVFGGLVVALIGVVYSALIVGYTLIEGRDVPGFAALMALMSFFCVFISLSLAVHGEYLWRMWIENNRQPEVVIKTAKLPKGRWDDDSLYGP